MDGARNLPSKRRVSPADQPTSEKRQRTESPVDSPGPVGAGRANEPESEARSTTPESTTEGDKVSRRPSNAATQLAARGRVRSPNAGEGAEHPASFLQGKTSPTKSFSSEDLHELDNTLEAKATGFQLQAVGPGHRLSAPTGGDNPRIAGRTPGNDSPAEKMATLDTNLSTSLPTSLPDGGLSLQWKPLAEELWSERLSLTMDTAGRSAIGSGEAGETSVRGGNEPSTAIGVENRSSMAFGKVSDQTSSRIESALDVENRMEPIAVKLEGESAMAVKLEGESAMAVKLEGEYAMAVKLEGEYAMAVQQEKESAMAVQQEKESAMAVQQEKESAMAFKREEDSAIAVKREEKSDESGNGAAAAIEAPAKNIYKKSATISDAKQRTEKGSEGKKSDSKRTPFNNIENYPGVSPPAPDTTAKFRKPHPLLKRSRSQIAPLSKTRLLRQVPPPENVISSTKERLSEEKYKLHLARLHELFEGEDQLYLGSIQSKMAEEADFDIDQFREAIVRMKDENKIMLTQDGMVIRI